MRKKPFLVLLLALSLCTPAWTVNKCTGADGKITYQDEECIGSKSEKLNISSNSDSGQSSSATGLVGGGTGAGRRTIHTGPRGGQFYYTESGNKTYVSRGRR